MKILIVLVVVVAGIRAYSFHQEWHFFKEKHEKVYENAEEENIRQQIYKENVQKINLHNLNYEKNLVSYKLAVNKFADMRLDEFTSLLNGFNKTAAAGVLPDKYSLGGITFISSAKVKIPESVDWRKEGAVTHVKNQGRCGSCWSFSATGAVEGQHFRKTGVLVSLSEQNLIDCSTKYGNTGCEGGLMDLAFKYIISNNGIDTEESYPYEAKNNECRYNAENSGATIKEYVDIEDGNEIQLQEAVATVGPVSVAIDASHDSFQFYSEGVLDDPNCSSTNLDHAVLVVGYGSSNKGQDYWIVKNSYGEDWGDKGYILMSRNKQNQCGIASTASYPLV